jgi:DNA repair protein RecO (recombination protein O)
MKTRRTNAIVLRRTNFGEADRILNLLTPDGKVSAIARGVRRENSKLSSGIELFAICDVVVTEGKGDLGILTAAQLVVFYRHIMEDYERMQFGYLAIKLVNQASETIDAEEWYEILSETLAGLDVLTIPLSLIQTWFYLRYSNMLGYELGLYFDISGNKIQADEKYRYNQNERGLEIFEQGSLTADHIKLMRLISTKPLKILIQIGGIGEVMATCLLTAREHASI